MNKEDLNQIATLKDLETFREKIVGDIKEIFSPKMFPQKEFYSPKEFSYLTGIPYSTVIYKCKTGKLKARQEDANCSWQVFVTEIDRFKREADENTL
jgi:hypothetical protein